MALVGGVWLGALYLGVDVRHVVFGALAESKVMDTLPEKWRPAQVEAVQTPTTQELAESVKTELVALRHEITALRTTRQNGLTSPTTSTVADNAQNAVSADVKQLTKQATLDYWTRLHSVIGDEIALQRDAESAATNSNATKVAALKGRISRLTASAIRALPISNVDPAAVTLAKDLANWYERSAEPIRPGGANLGVFGPGVRRRASLERMGAEPDTASQRGPTSGGSGDGGPRLLDAAVWRRFCRIFQAVARCRTSPGKRAVATVKGRPPSRLKVCKLNSGRIR